MLRIPNLHGRRICRWRSRECVGVFLLGGLRQSERTLRSQRQLDCILVAVLIIAHPGLRRRITGMGAHLARREGRILLEELAARGRGLNRVGAGKLRSSALIHTYDHLPVELMR